MSLDVNSLLSSMVTAASDSLGEDWVQVKDYATTQFQQTAATLAMIERDTLNGTITQEQAQNLLDIQKQAAESVMLAVATMTAAAVQRAINAALVAVRQTVNTAVGFTLV